MTAFVDTNVLLYADDRSGGAKTTIAGELIDNLLLEDGGRISMQILKEYYANATGKLGMGRDVAATRARLYARLGLVPLEPDILWSAMDLHRLEPISFWDALVVRTAQAARCTILYTEDLQDGRVYDGVRIVNPFAGAA